MSGAGSMAFFHPRQAAFLSWTGADTGVSGLRNSHFCNSQFLNSEFARSLTAERVAC